MKPTKAMIALSLLLLTQLSGCFYLAETHPTTESRIMTAAEQQYWADRRMRQEKGAEWSRELERQSSERMSRYWN